jgi:hypothetical protein
MEWIFGQPKSEVLQQSKLVAVADEVVVDFVFNPIIGLRFSAPRRFFYLNADGGNFPRLSVLQHYLFAYVKISYNGHKQTKNDC